MTAFCSLEDIEPYPVRIPMRHTFRRLNHREAVVLRGPAGWGEFSPFPEYPLEVAARWLGAGLESACTHLPAPVRDRIPVNVTIPATDPGTARRLVEESGCRTAKVKVAEPGQGQFEELARVEAVREALGVQGRIRVDANAAWDLPTAVDRIRRLAPFDLEYVEQPVATLEDMRRLRQEVDVPVAADESIRHLQDPLQVAEQEAADVIVLKVQPLGGVRRTLETAARCGLPVVVSSALETSVGMAAGAAAAAALPDLPFACGLGTVALLAGDVVDRSLLPVDGDLEVRRPAPDPGLLHRFHPGPDRAEEMLGRLKSAAELLR